MELSKRLAAVVELVTGRTMADIGTDHGYVPFYLYQKGRIEKAIACDINRQPLEKARENCMVCGDSIEMRLGNGLEPLAVGEVESIVIAGMGGMLIIELLERGKAVRDSAKELILCPHLDMPEVRKYLHKNGYAIVAERMVQEEGKFYTILRAVQGQEQYDREIEYLYGKLLLEEKDTALQGYLQQEQKRIEKIEQAIQGKETEQAKRRKEEIEQEKAYLKEAMAWQSVVKK